MNGKSTRVLIVDDESAVVELVRSQLIGLGYAVAGAAYDGPEAVELTRQLRPDVVLMDLRMPDPETGRDDPLAGLAAARAIQEECPAPVILLTAHESSKLIRQACGVGVGAYLVKPARNSEIDRAITIALARFDDLATLRRLNADLDAYAHSVAHDLKGPLTVMVGAAQVLEEEYGMLLDQEARRLLHKIALRGYKMSSIIDSLLLLAGARGMGKVDMAPLDMAYIVAEAQKRLTGLIKEHGDEKHTPSEIILPPGNSWPVAMGYAPWVEEIWINYLSNALKYGARPGDDASPRIELGFDEWTNGERRIANDAIRNPQFTIPHLHVRFWVRDNGLGLTLEEQSRLFTPFTRLEQTVAKGHGLGLSITHRIVEKMGGQVGVESKVGRGSLFWFTLPGRKV